MVLHCMLMMCPGLKNKCGRRMRMKKMVSIILFFPAKDYDGIFKIGVAISDSPTGPFTHNQKLLKKVFQLILQFLKMMMEVITCISVVSGADNCNAGEQVNLMLNKAESPTAHLPKDDEPALCAKVAKLTDDLLEFAEDAKDVVIVDENGKPLLQGDIERRFFEARWMHKYNGKYYFSYSTGDTHFICYAIADNPYGPFKYAGRILNPVVGWTSHHSIVEFNNEWYLFYHDSSLSKGVTHLRSIKVTKLEHDENGFIKTIDPYNDFKALV